MPLTPSDVHNVSFTKPALGYGGYGEEEVDAFLDEVERELGRLMAENDALKSHIGTGDDHDELRELTARLRLLEEARDRAEQHAREVAAELERARRSDPAPPGGDDRQLRVLAMAQRTADGHLEDARQEAEQIIGAAEEQADQLAADARARASDIEGAARRRHAEAMEGLADRRARLLEEVEQLGGLAMHYRSALGQHVANQLDRTDTAPRLTDR
jgi:DivIVA domain-containing protein